MNNQARLEASSTEPTGGAIGGTLLIAGTCMGAGMLALPVATAMAGFFPALLINISVWLFMMATGLLFLEATLRMPDGANVISMAGRYLGSAGKLMGGGFFIFLYYCLMVAYLSGGTPYIQKVVETAFGFDLGWDLSFLLIIALFGGIVFLGAWLVDRVNWILMSGLVLSYLFLVGIGADDVDSRHFSHAQWGLTLFAAPTLFSAFGYHNIIPTLCTYLRRDRRQLRWAVIVGTTLPFLIYTVWQWLIIGTVPYEELQRVGEQNIPISEAFMAATGNSWVSKLILFFGCFAIVTSLLGVSLSMIDFIGDGTGLERRGFSRLLITSMVFLPPAFLAYKNPEIFVEALGVAGGIGESFMNGLLPIAMAWIGRYRLRLDREEMLPGGKLLLAFLFAFGAFIMGLESWHLYQKAVG